MNTNSNNQPAKHHHIPNSTTKSYRHEACWDLEIHKQEKTDKLVPITELPLAELPPGLHGYTFIVGALFQAQNKPEENGTQLYTGDGMVYRLGFEDGKAMLKTRIAKTPCYYADPATKFYLLDWIKNKEIRSFFVKKHKLFSYFTAFRDGGQSRFSVVLGARNQLNTAFLKTRDHLLLTIDAGRPYLIDPDSMELLEPVGSTKEWFSIFPVVSRLTWINIFEVYINSAHYVTDITKLNNQQDELYSTNYSTGYNGRFKNIVNSVLEKECFHNFLEMLYGFLGQKYDKNQELGRFTYLIRYKFNDEQKKLPPKMERWRLVLTGDKPVLVEQSLHQLAITQKYIILADIAFKMEFSQIFSPFIFGFLKLFRSVNNRFLERLIYAIFVQAIKPLPFADIYIVNRQDLDKENQLDATVTIRENIPRITVKKVRLPREISHFAADYSNPDHKITLHVGHVNGWDVTEWITHYDQPVPGKPPKLRSDLEGMMVGSTDLGSLGRYIIDGETGEIESCETIRDPELTWALSIYTHRDINRDSLTETAQEIKNIYWLSLGFTWELIPQRIYDAYKADPTRVIPVEDLPDDNKPITLLRLDTQQMKIVDYYQFPSGTYVSSIQFIPSSLPCPEERDESIHGFIVCAVMLDINSSEPRCVARDEFWIFHAHALNKEPIYRLSSRPDAQYCLNLAMTIHSTWLQDIHPGKYTAEERQKKREESLEKDYQDVVQKSKCPAVQELFNDIVFPGFKQQLSEEEFEKILLRKDN